MGPPWNYAVIFYYVPSQGCCMENMFSVRSIKLRRLFWELCSTFKFFENTIAMYLSLLVIFEMCFKNHFDLHSLHTMSIGEMNNKVIGKWSESVNDEDKQVGMQVRELCTCIESNCLNECVYDGRNRLIIFLCHFICIIILSDLF